MERGSQEPNRTGANLRVGLTLASVAAVFFLGIILKYVVIPS